MTKISNVTLAVTTICCSQKSLQKQTNGQTERYRCKICYSPVGPLGGPMGEYDKLTSNALRLLILA